MFGKVSGVILGVGLDKSSGQYSEESLEDTSVEFPKKSCKDFFRKNDQESVEGV